jgi:hypothetical protein
MPTDAPPTAARRIRWRLLGRAFGLLQRLGYWESRLMARVPLAMVVDLACRKVPTRHTGHIPAQDR